MAGISKELAYVLTIALLGTLFTGVLSADRGSAAGWNFGSTSITAPANYDDFYPGQSIVITITGNDGDNTPNDNFIDVEFAMAYGAGTIIQGWYHELPTNGITWQMAYTLPVSLSLGTYYLTVYNNQTGTPVELRYITMYVVSASSFWELDIDDSQYTHTSTYVPTEVMKFRVEGVPDQEFDLKIKQGDTLWKEFLAQKTDGGGCLNITWDNPPLPADAPDAAYTAAIYQKGTETIYDSVSFTVSLYTLELGLERDYFIIGEKVVVKYRVTNNKDGTLTTIGTGVWKAFNDTNYQMATGTVTSAVGSFSFDIPTSAQPDYLGYRVEMWFNDTHDAGSKRHSHSVEYFTVDNLACSVSTDRSVYQPGGIVQVTVTSTLKNSVSHTIPGVSVNNIVVSSRPSGSSSWTVVPEYGATSLTTDEGGRASYIFRLKDDTADKTEFKVEANITKLTSVSGSSFFSVSKGSSALTISMWLDKDLYTCGETVKVTVDATAPAGMTIMYHYSVLKQYGTDYDVLDLNVSEKNTYSYVLPSDYIGTVLFYVDAITNSDGLTASDSESINVVYAKMVVNTDKETFKPKDTVTVNYKLTSALMNSPKLYYKITSGSMIVLEKDISSTSQSGSFTYKVPEVPSSSYTFTVYANQNGRTISGSETISEASGYLLVATLDKRVAAPGETVTAKYSLIPQGHTPKIDSIATITIGISGSSKYVDVNTLKREGTVSYVIPNDIKDGSRLFIVHASVDGSGYTADIVLDIDSNPSLENVPSGDVAALSVGAAGLGIGVIGLLFAFMALRKLKALTFGGIAGHQAAPHPEQQQQAPPPQYMPQPPQQAHHAPQAPQPPQQPAPQAPQPPQQPAPQAPQPPQQPPQGQMPPPPQ